MAHDQEEVLRDMLVRKARRIRATSSSFFCRALLYVVKQAHEQHKHVREIDSAMEGAVEEELYAEAEPLANLLDLADRDLPGASARLLATLAHELNPPETPT
jgi:hypothetical protein